MLEKIRRHIKHSQPAATTITPAGVFFEVPIGERLPETLNF